MTTCKPISNTDLAEYLADCVNDEDMLNRIRGTLSNPDKGTPISQSSGENEIDMRLLIDLLKNK